MESFVAVFLLGSSYLNLSFIMENMQDCKGRVFGRDRKAGVAHRTWKKNGMRIVRPNIQLLWFMVCFLEIENILIIGEECRRNSIRNGATIYYGNQQSAASTQEAAKELKEKILQIVEETKCEKVNIIAHSKGGLESRCAISCLGLAPYVASLTTINTPHRGCAFVDWLLKKMPKCVCDRIANGYNKTLRRFGDPVSRFLCGSM